jgi:hypothetical protein
MGAIRLHCLLRRWRRRTRFALADYLLVGRTLSDNFQIRKPHDMFMAERVGFVVSVLFKAPMNRY